MCLGNGWYTNAQPSPTLLLPGVLGYNSHCHVSVAVAIANNGNCGLVWKASGWEDWDIAILITYLIIFVRSRNWLRGTDNNKANERKKEKEKQA